MQRSVFFPIPLEIPSLAPRLLGNAKEMKFSVSTIVEWHGMRISQILGWPRLFSPSPRDALQDWFYSLSRAKPTKDPTAALLSLGSRLTDMRISSSTLASCSARNCLDGYCLSHAYFDERFTRMAIADWPITHDRKRYEMGSKKNWMTDKTDVSAENSTTVKTRKNSLSSQSTW